jgi:transmembrane sensor
MPDTAEGWFARLRAGSLTEEEAAGLESWLAESEAHRARLEELSRLWETMEAVRAEPAVLAMRERALRASSPMRRRTLAAVAACAVLCAAGGIFFVIQQRGPWHASVAQVHAMSYETRVGQKSTITLPDGSLLVLDTDSALEAWSTASERRVRLLRGRAFFNVEKDASRPFSVTAGGNTVTAVGTEFDVELKPRSMEVTLLSGRLRVRGAGAVGGRAGESEVEMSAGHRLIAAQGKSWRMRPADPQLDTGWLRGQLVFDEETLANIAAALNRYSTRKIMIADPEVASKRLSAVFTAGDIDTFVHAADTLGLARTGANDSQRVVLVAP